MNQYLILPKQEILDVMKLYKSSNGGWIQTIAQMDSNKQNGYDTMIREIKQKLDEIKSGIIKKGMINDEETLYEFERNNFYQAMGRSLKILTNVTQSYQGNIWE